MIASIRSKLKLMGAAKWCPLALFTLRASTRQNQIRLPNRIPFG